MFTSILVICIFGLSSSLAQIPSIREGCPDPTVVQNFNVTAYLGKWYEQEKYPFLFEAGGRCITADYSLKDDGNVKVFNRMLVGTIPSSIEGFAKLNSTNGEAKLAVTFNVPIAVTSPYWVLDTDYSSYSVVWSCADVFGISASTAWILTREQNPPSSLIENAYSVLKQKNIKTDLLTKTEQTNCN